MLTSKAWNNPGVPKNRHNLKAQPHEQRVVDKGQIQAFEFIVVVTEGDKKEALGNGSNEDPVPIAAYAK